MLVLWVATASPSPFLPSEPGLLLSAVLPTGLPLTPISGSNSALPALSDFAAVTFQFLWLNLSRWKGCVLCFPPHQTGTPGSVCVCVCAWFPCVCGQSFVEHFPAPSPTEGLRLPSREEPQTPFHCID